MDKNMLKWAKTRMPSQMGEPDWVELSQLTGLGWVGLGGHEHRYR